MKPKSNERGTSFLALETGDEADLASRALFAIPGITSRRLDDPAVALAGQLREEAKSMRRHPEAGHVSAVGQNLARDVVLPALLQVGLDPESDDAPQARQMLAEYLLALNGQELMNDPANNN